MPVSQKRKNMKLFFVPRSSFDISIRHSPDPCLIRLETVINRKRWRTTMQIVPGKGRRSVRDLKSNLTKVLWPTKEKIKKKPYNNAPNLTTPCSPTQRTLVHRSIWVRYLYLCKVRTRHTRLFRGTATNSYPKCLQKSIKKSLALQLLR